ncbi:MAG: hypothetical protein JSV79_07460, partial [Armatimonadota bacterium]
MFGRWACVVAVLLLCATPAVANDLTDWLQSPGSETLEIGQAFLDFTKDTVTDPDGIGFGLIAGTEANAWTVSFDRDWRVQTGVAQVPQLDLAVLCGLRVETGAWLRQFLREHRDHLSCRLTGRPEGDG